MDHPRPTRTPRNREARLRDAQHRFGPPKADVTALEDYLVRRAGRSADSAHRRPREGDHDIRHDRVRGALGHARNNDLLAALSGLDFERLRPALELVDLPVGRVLVQEGWPATHAYFPVSGIVSLTQELANGGGAEIAIAGFEGMVGTALFMGGGASVGRAMVRGAGAGYRVRADVLRAEFDESRALRDVLLRYAHDCILQMAQIAVCRGHHSIEEQVCRFLLATLDRSARNDLALTQEAIGRFLGVRRESVTAVAGLLQGAGILRYHCGRITVLDRHELEARACECYGAVRNASARRGGETNAYPHRQEALSASCRAGCD